MNRKIGVSIGSAWSRSDGISTAGTRRAAGAGVAAVDGVGRGRGNLQRGVDIPGRWSRGPARLGSIIYSGVHYRLLSLFVGASSTTEGLEF